MIEVGIVPLCPRTAALLSRALGPEFEILKDDGLVWAAVENGEPIAAVTAYVTTDKAIEVVLGGGDLKGLRAIRDRLCQWARDEGAGVVRIIGRLGWARVFGMRVVAFDGEAWELELKL